MWPYYHARATGGEPGVGTGLVTCKPAPDTPDLRSPPDIPQPIAVMSLMSQTPPHTIGPLRAGRILLLWPQPLCRRGSEPLCPSPGAVLVLYVPRCHTERRRYVLVLLLGGATLMLLLSTPLSS